MRAHFSQYAEAYFKALLYLTLQYSVAIVGCPAPAGAGFYARLVYFARLSTLALPAMLAFMDGSVLRNRMTPRPAPKVPALDLEKLNRELTPPSGA